MASSGSNTAGSTSYSTSSSAAGRLRGALGLGDDGGDPLADEAHDVVEHVRVVGIDEVVLVPSPCVERRAGTSSQVKTADDPGTASALSRPIDADDARVRVRRRAGP